MATTPRQFRLTDSDLEMLDNLVQRWGLSNRTEAIRHAIQLAAQQEDAVPQLTAAVRQAIRTAVREEFGSPE